MDSDTDTGDVPSGMPETDGPEEQPLGPTEADPDSENTGEDAMPGIPTEGEPPSGG